VDSLQWYDQIRFMTVIIALGATFRSSQKAWDNWTLYTRRLKDLWFVLTMLMLFLIESNLEQVILNAGFGPRVPASLLLAIIAFRAQLREEGYIHTERE
jgi:hypothetical protein